MTRALLFALVALLALPAHAKSQAQQGVRTLYLVRHGMYDRTSADDRAGNGLNALGQEQAALLGQFLAKLPVRMTSVVSSNLRRAKETAAKVGAALKMTPAEDPLLAECTPTSHLPEMNQGAPPQQLAACDQQLEAAWAKYVRPSPAADTHDVLVGHGNAIRWMVAKAVAGDGRRWLSMEIANAAITVITVWPDGSTRLVMFSAPLGIPVEKQTWAGRGAGWSEPVKSMR